MLIERSERGAENGGKSGTDAKNGRDGEGGKSAREWKRKRARKN